MTTPVSFTQGQRLRSWELDKLQPVQAIRQFPSTCTGYDTTLISDSVLKVPLPFAGAQYIFDAMILWNSGSADLRFEWGVPTRRQPGLRHQRDRLGRRQFRR